MERYVAEAVHDMHAARDQLLAAFGEVGADDWRRFVPYGDRTLHDLLAHVAASDHAWALAAKGLLKGESEERDASDRMAAEAARERAVARGRRRSPEQLLEEMESRRKLLLGLFELLEPRHLALPLPAFGERYNSARERIWLGWHDRQHAADVRAALRMAWHPPKLKLLPEVLPAGRALSPDAALYVIHSVDQVEWERPSPLEGWTNRGLLAHIATGDWVFQKHLRSVVERGCVAEWPDVAAGNARLLEERRSSTVGALVEEFRSMRHESVLLLARLKPKHFGLKLTFWWEPQPNEHTLLEYLLRFPRHEASHAEQLRPAMRHIRSDGGR
ncbi:MAG: DinB family protein [Dehalococcoidia bacterium]